MIALRMPPLHASPSALLRSGLRWLKRPGQSVVAREPIAVCSVRLRAPPGVDLPLPEEQHDLQVVLGAPEAGMLGAVRSHLSRGGFQDLIGQDQWDAGETIAELEGTGPPGDLVPLVLAGRRGFESGEGRGGLLVGWHDRARAFWPGEAARAHGTVLSLGTCEQTTLYRGDDRAFLPWFSRAPGPAQIVWVSDERTVHSSAVLLQHLRRTADQARAIAASVHAWMGEVAGAASFPAFEGGATSNVRRSRWPESQDLLFAQHLLSEALSASPIVEGTDLLTNDGVVLGGPPDAIALSMGSELSPHFRHRTTGFTIAIHGFRFGTFVGERVRDWLRRDFERVRRTVADVERDHTALVDEISRRTGASVLLQNIIATSPADRISNYGWLGDAFRESAPVACNEMNSMVAGLAKHPSVAVIDADAVAAEVGVRHCPDRNHASRELVEALQSEIHHVLRERHVAGFLLT